MSTHDTEAPAVAAPGGNPLKLLTILVTVALVLSVASVGLGVMQMLHPASVAIEQANGELKDTIDSNGSAIAKRLDHLKDACIDWQAVLKTASDKPDATFRIIKTEDGLLTLSEIK